MCLRSVPLTREPSTVRGTNARDRGYLGYGRRSMTVSPDLELAYQRPCFICRQLGWCKHREPQVELALMRVQLAKVEIKVKGVAA